MSAAIVAIRIGRNRRNEGLATEVYNTGPTISAANLPRIWDRFFTTRADEGGTGLGLTIVASVVRAHGGTVFCESDRERGTTFRVTLPTVDARA